MTEKPPQPEKPQLLIDRLQIDMPGHFSHEEKMQIYRELKEREGKVRAELVALDAYLAGQWDPVKIAEQYPEAAKKGHDFPPEATFQVPGTNVRIDPVGIVGSRELKEDRAKRRETGFEYHKLTWDYNCYRPKVQEYAQDPEKLKKLIEAAEHAKIQIPDTIREHFEKIQKAKEELDQAFERGQRFVATFARTSLEEYFSAPTAPEEIELDIRLKDGGDPSNPDHWRANSQEGDYTETMNVISIKQLTEKELELELEHGYGDASNGESNEIEGTVTVNIETGQIIGGTLRAGAGYADGSFEAEYSIGE